MRLSHSLAAETTLEVRVGPHRREFAPWTPGDGRVFADFAFAVKTPPIRDPRSPHAPDYVLGVACDAVRGVFVPLEHAAAFFDAHADGGWIFHDAASAMAVLRRALGDGRDVDRLADGDRAWDTALLARLLRLATGSGPEAFSLRACAEAFLNLRLPDGVTDRRGWPVERGFGRYLHAPVAAIPVAHRRHAAGEALATWELFHALKARIRQFRLAREGGFGDLGDRRLQAAWDAWGPLSHHIQLRASLLCDELRRTGVAVDSYALEAARAEVRAGLTRLRAKLAALGRESLVSGGADGQAAQRALIDAVHARRPDLPLLRTETGLWALSEEQFDLLAPEEPAFAALAEHAKLQNLERSHLRHLDAAEDRVHATFRPLVSTGRMACAKPNLQNLPRSEPGVPDVRACVGAAPGFRLLAVDFQQVELCTLAVTHRDQLGLGDTLAKRINAGEDLHRAIAGTLLRKGPADVTDEERASVKAVSFGRPGGMGAAALRDYSRKTFGASLTEEQVSDRIRAYEQVVPELARYLEDDVDAAAGLAAELRLTPRGYRDRTGRGRPGPDDDAPAAWLGGMLLRVLETSSPATRGGRPYDADELDHLWSAAASLAGRLDAVLSADLAARRASPELSFAAKDPHGRRTAWTLTGRARAGCTFAQSRNTPFQGLAADGLILALWDLRRAGYHVVLAVHDEIVLEIAEDAVTDAVVRDVTGRMERAMNRVVPGIRIRAEPKVGPTLGDLRAYAFDADPPERRSPAEDACDRSRPA